LASLAKLRQDWYVRTNLTSKKTKNSLANTQHSPLTNQILLWRITILELFSTYQPENMYTISAIMDVFIHVNSASHWKRNRWVLLDKETTKFFHEVWNTAS